MEEEWWGREGGSVNYISHSTFSQHVSENRRSQLSFFEKGVQLKTYQSKTGQKIF